MSEVKKLDPVHDGPACRVHASADPGQRRRRHSGQTGSAIREKAYGIWQTYTWQDYLRYVRLTALGLFALGLKGAAGRDRF